MKTSSRFVASILSLLLVAGAARADLFDQLGLSKKKDVPQNTNAAVAALSEGQVVQGLKEALSKGLQQAIGRLGHEGGFLTNLNVKIPLPEKVRSVEKTLRAVKQEKLADEFVATMNRAAEQAVPEAATVFADGLRQMSVTDAKAVLTSTNNAATEYFRRTTQTNLFAKFHPIVQKATAQAGVTASYKRMMEKVSLSSSFGAFGNSLLSHDAVDIDSYVTNQAMEGLFKMVAEEEKRIRENPLARTSDVLQKVFGSLKR